MKTLYDDAKKLDELESKIKIEGENINKMFENSVNDTEKIVKQHSFESIGEAKDSSNNENKVIDEWNESTDSEERPGDGGDPVTLSDEEKKKERIQINEGWKHNAFNQYVSDLISLNRTLPDPRHPECKQKGWIEIVYLYS